MSPLNGALISTPNPDYRVSLVALPPGTYKFARLVHVALHMTGQIVVQP